MGFYIRKSISVGPFRFNLSTSGVGVSAGVKGFRVGTGPRGNYVHMGRGGLYYRASLGGSSSRHVLRHGADLPPAPKSPASSYGDAYAPIQVETGNVLEMSPIRGAQIVDEINEKLALMNSWPWVIGVGGLLFFTLAMQPGTAPFALITLAITAIATAVAARWDQGRKAVVVMYDLDDHVLPTFKNFSDEFDKLAKASRVWNVDTAQQTADWKRNAGAGRLLTRKNVQLAYSVPSVVKTNISVPSITGGSKSVFFFPDVAVVVSGKLAGAIGYNDLIVAWNTTVFIEEESVPSDSQVVGQTWRFVNKNGGPDRRFNNNRQVPKVLYQQMGLRGPGQFQKILHVSRVEDRSEFDRALRALGAMVKTLEHAALPPPVKTPA